MGGWGVERRALHHQTRKRWIRMFTVSGGSKGARTRVLTLVVRRRSAGDSPASARSPAAWRIRESPPASLCTPQAACVRRCRCPRKHAGPMRLPERATTGAHPLMSLCTPNRPRPNDPRTLLRPHVRSGCLQRRQRQRRRCSGGDSMIRQPGRASRTAMRGCRVERMRVSIVRGNYLPSVRCQGPPRGPRWS